MAKVKKSKITIKTTKIDDNGKKEVKNKTFSKNNKKFKKEVDETKKLLEEVSEYEYSVKDFTDSEEQKIIDAREYKELITETEKIENNIWLDAKYNFALFKTGMVSFGNGIKCLFKGIWYSIKYIFTKKK